MRSPTRSVAAAAATAALLACVVAAAGGPAPPRADFVLGNGVEIRSLDPALATAAPEARVARALFEGLVVLDPKSLAPLPGAAESWAVSDDAKTWTFRLRANGLWSDGAPVVADDFAWSLIRLLRPETGSRAGGMLHDVRGARTFAAAAARGDTPRTENVGVRAVDRLTLEIALERPAPALLQILALPALAPVRRDRVEPLGARWTAAGAFVSNGPFRLAGRTVRDRIRLVRNERYWDASNVGLATFDVLAVDSLNTLVNLYVAGDVDWVTDAPPSLVDALRRDRPRDLRTSPLAGTYFFRVNTARPGLRNRRVREALDLALDKAALVGALLHAGETAARSLVPAAGDAAPDGVAGDPAAARAALKAGLAEEGLRELPPIELAYNSGALHQSICEIMQSRWRDVLGIRVVLARQEQQAFLAAVERRDYDLARGSWLADYVDPLSFLEVFASTNPINRTGWSDARFDALVGSLARDEIDPVRRARLLDEARAILDAAHAVLPIYRYAAINLIRPDVGGFADNVLDVHFPKFLSRAPGAR